MLLLLHHLLHFNFTASVCLQAPSAERRGRMNVETLQRSNRDTDEALGCIVQMMLP